MRSAIKFSLSISTRFASEGPYCDAERIAIDHYRELINYFGVKDSTTRTMLEGILAVEEEHANDMHDLLVAHEGRPFIKK